MIIKKLPNIIFALIFLLIVKKSHVNGGILIHIKNFIKTI